MKANKKQEEELKAWFTEPQGFWQLFGGDYTTPSQKGGRGKALQIIYKINPDIDMRKKMLANMKAQLRACDKDRKSGQVSL